jgi:hypothetical protein
MGIDHDGDTSFAKFHFEQNGYLGSRRILKMKKPDIPIAFWSLAVFAALIVSYSAYLAFSFAQQPPLDVHSFRQTQTALTAYWFTQEGFSLAYQTPVGGVPWAIPFEFPLYQLIVACLSQLLNLSLDFTGRITSYVFLLLCILPVRSITTRLELPTSVLAFFVAIAFSAPIYVYWGRSFMIETMALFLSISAIKYFLDLLLGKPALRPALLFTVLITLSILQKATTGLPVLGLMSIVFLTTELKKAGSIRAVVFNKYLLWLSLCFITPLAVGFAWVRFTDQIKSLSPLGAHLTSTALSKWNWGTMSQKMSSDIWSQVVWERMLMPNMGAALGLFILVSPFLIRTQLKAKLVVLSSLALGISPLFLFTNLHLVHDYYQTANAIFLIYALSVALGCVILPTMGQSAAILILVFIVVSNFAALKTGYLGQIKKVFDKENRDVAIGDILKRELPPGMQFIAFGNDWSSTFAYVSQRKSFTVPGWFGKYDQVVSNPENFVETGRLGGIVSCSVDTPNVSKLMKWATDGRSWKIGETHGCLIVTPQRSLESKVWMPVNCEGNIERAEVEDRNGHKVISFSGWTTMAGAKSAIPDQVFLILSSGYSAPVYLQTLKVPRLDVNKHLEIPRQIDAGFSRLISNNLKPGEYEVGIRQYADDQYQACQWKKKILVK